MNFMVHWLNNKEMTYTDAMDRLVAEVDRLEQQQHDASDRGQSRRRLRGPSGQGEGVAERLGKGSLVDKVE